MIIGEIYPNFIIKCIQLVGGDASDTIYIGIFFKIWKLFCVGLIVYFIFFPSILNSYHKKNPQKLLSEGF